MWEIQNIHWYERCRTIPSYNYENETKSLYCSIHKEDEMVYVKSKTCTHEVKGYLFIITRMRQKVYFVQYIRKLEWLTKSKKWRVVSQRGVISGSNNSNNVKGDQNSLTHTKFFSSLKIWRQSDIPIKWLSAEFTDKHITWQSVYTTH